MVITYNDKIIVSKEMKQVRKYDLKKKRKKITYLLSLSKIIACIHQRRQNWAKSD